MTFRHFKNEELINHIDMDMDATPREKELAMRLALTVDALDDLQEAYDAMVEPTVTALAKAAA